MHGHVTFWSAVFPLPEQFTGRRQRHLLMDAAPLFGKIVTLERSALGSVPAAWRQHKRQAGGNDARRTFGSRFSRSMRRGPHGSKNRYFSGQKAAPGRVESEQLAAAYLGLSQQAHLRCRGERPAMAANVKAAFQATVQSGETGHVGLRHPLHTPGAADAIALHRQPHHQTEIHVRSCLCHLQGSIFGCCTMGCLSESFGASCINPEFSRKN